LHGWLVGVALQSFLWGIAMRCEWVLVFWFWMGFFFFCFHFCVLVDKLVIKNETQLGNMDGAGD